MIPRLRQGGQQRSKPVTLPAPIGGINATRALSSMEPNECIYMYNMIPRDYGAQVRGGYSEWANGWTGSVDARTVIAFEGTADDGSKDRLWVANDAGIWNVTTLGTTSPVQDVTWAATGIPAGQCTYVQYTTDAAGSFLLLCDETNGYYVYTESTDTWAKIAQGAGGTEVDNVDPGDFAYVTVFKERVWFIEKDTGYAWYLAAGSIYGAATRFNFGRNFRIGGSLKVLLNWTLDGGAGIDDYLVGVSEAGDVVIYQGTDPSSATFGMVGVWNVGKVPAGRRIGTDFGGEAYILSVQGLLPLSQVLNGSSISDPKLYLTYKVSPFLRDSMDTSIDDYGWTIYHTPSTSGLAIGTPKVTGEDNLQYVFDYGTQAWGISRGIDVSHAANWQGTLYFTDTQTNKLWYANDVASDKIHLDAETDGVAQAITFSILTSYQPYTSPAQYKRMQFLRPLWLGAAIPVFNIQARYDFDINEVSTTPPVTGTTSSSLWDAAASKWDEAIWGGSLDPSDNPRGAVGLGRHIAVAMRGESAADVTLVGVDAIWDEGGLM